jgi:FtsH-binding integral membrane protein
MSIAISLETTAERRERLFFLSMALGIAATVLIAFSLFYVAGISSFGAPWWVHIHAVTFVIWIVFYVSQNTLVVRNDIALHRKLGRMGAMYVVWMVVVGLVLTPLTLAVGRSPPFFTPPYFLALDWMNILVFALLMYAAIHNRTRTDWHRRLMVCATICIIAPAWGRLIVLSGNPMTAFNNTGMLLLYVVVAMIADWHIRGRIHPAYFWGAGALVGMGLSIEALAVFPPFVALAERIVG